MYTLNTFIISFLALVLLMSAVELGYRLGLKKSKSFSDVIKDHINSVAMSLLGILALLLGFTFSLSLQRFDSRSDAVVAEANAIGTSYLRTELLDNEFKTEARKYFDDYIKIRIADSLTSLVDLDERKKNALRINELQRKIWGVVVSASKKGADSPKLALLIQSVNETFDSLGAREASLNRHVPGLVLTLLLLTLILSGAVLGYAAGASGHRVSAIVYVMNVLIIIIVFIIFDLDRPRRGLIQVNQTPILNLEMLINNNNANQ